MSKLEETLALHLRAEKIPFEREVMFHPTRKWRFDFVLAPNIAVEVEGGTYVRGAHNRGMHMASDMEKYNEAARLGWSVYRFDTHMVNDGRAIDYMKRILKEVL